MTAPVNDAWDSGQAYERYIGRWSRRVAAEFLGGMDTDARGAWVDVGCGTGALTSAILAHCEPRSVDGIDASQAFISRAQEQIDDPRVRLRVGDAAHLPWPWATFEVAVSGLVLNFVTDPPAMIREMARVTRTGGRVAVYVWDYADGMQMLRRFWDAASAIDANARAIDEAKRFPVCQPGPLAELFEHAGLRSVGVTAVEVPTVFNDFDDYWQPFLGRSGPAPAYVASLDDGTRERIRSHLESQLAGDGGPINLVARAWAAQGVVT